jgi:hypothetical protein
VIRTARRPLGGTWSSVETISPSKKRKLTRARYRATITPNVGTRTLKPIQLKFRIRR